MALAAAIALAGCQQPKPAAQAPAPTPPPYDVSIPLHDFMEHVLEPQTDIVWSASGVVVDFKGEHDISPKTDEAWARIVPRSSIASVLVPDVPTSIPSVMLTAVSPSALRSARLSP